MTPPGGRERQVAALPNCAGANQSRRQRRHRRPSAHFVGGGRFAAPPINLYSNSPVAFHLIFFSFFVEILFRFYVPKFAISKSTLASVAIETAENGVGFFTPISIFWLFA